MDAIAKLLTEKGFRRVDLLTQTAGSLNFRHLPTGKNIRESLEALLKNRQPHDTVLVAFAGHGVQFQDSEENYFCPMDAELDLSLIHI